MNNYTVFNLMQDDSNLKQLPPQEGRGREREEEEEIEEEQNNNNNLPRENVFIQT
jgi:hypothetical protein